MNPYEYSFPLFKGLQKPLEFMGLRGRFITLAAVGVGSGFFGYIVTMLIFGQLVGFISLAIIALTSLAVIFIKQKQGLHNKKRSRDHLIYHSIYKR